MATLLESPLYQNHVEKLPLDRSPFSPSMYTDQYPREEIRSPVGQRLNSPTDRTEIKIKNPTGSFMKHMGNYDEVMSPERPEYPPQEDSEDGISIVEDDTPIIEEPLNKVEEQKIRADYRVKLSVLREAYPEMQIPQYPDDQFSVEEITEAFKNYKRRIHIDASVEQNKNYLLIAWLLIEAAGSRWLKEYFQGYTLNQFKMIGKYQELLIEMGERNYVETGGGFPAEIKIVIMTAVNAVVFLVLKLMSSYVGIKDTDQIKDFVMNMFTNSKGDEALRRADNASSENVPPPKFEKEPTVPMGDMGSMLGTLMSMFTGGNNDNKAPPPKAQRKRPTGFAARTSV